MIKGDTRSLDSSSCSDVPESAMSRNARSPFCTSDVLMLSMGSPKLKGITLSDLFRPGCWDCSRVYEACRAGSVWGVCCSFAWEMRVLSQGSEQLELAQTAKNASRGQAGSYCLQQLCPPSAC